MENLHWIKVGKCRIAELAYDSDAEALWIKYDTGELEKRICFIEPRWLDLKRSIGMSLPYFKEKLDYCFRHSISILFEKK